VTSSTAFAEHLERPHARGHTPAGAHTGAAGGAACGDLIRISVSLEPSDPDGRIADAGFDAAGCGAAIAAGSATVALLRRTTLLQAAHIGPEQIADELGGLSPTKRHAAELAADALHRALGAAARAQARLANTPGRALVAMSGGVDSAVAALLARDSGEQAIGVTLELWSDPANDASLSCCSADAVRSARALAHELGLPHLSIDLRAEFRAGVVDPWLSEHAAGLTPNPCVRCNGFVRLDAMLELATRLGAATLATGHYARVHRASDWDAPGSDARCCHAPGDGDAEPEPHSSAAPGESARRGPLLRIAADPQKDQSYALAALSAQSLARLRFPLGGLTKAEVRALAQRAGLAVARQRDSQDLCFLAGTSQREFLAHHARLGRRPGAIVDPDGTRLGAHDGLHTVTIGQRRGLGIAAREPLFVLATDPASGTVTVGPRACLLTRTVAIRDLVLRRDAPCVDAVKLRYRGRLLACRMSERLPAGAHAAASVELLQPAERTAPGQIACLYAGELVVGHGTIAA
jgi:tRNA-uridine 2-sulfurtransferase